MTMLDDFESALLTQLRTEVHARQFTPVTRRPWKRLAAVAAAATTAVVGATVAIGGSSPAFAVAQTDSGDLVVTVHRLDDAAGLERALADLGVTADVRYNGDSIDRAFSPADLPTGTARYTVAECATSVGPAVEAVDGGFQITIPSVDIGSGENLSVITAGSTPSTADLLVAYGNRDSGCVQQPGSNAWTVYTPAWDDAN